MTYDEQIAVLQAAKEGKALQVKLSDGRWEPTNSKRFNFRDYDFRVAPEPREFWITKAGNVYIRSYPCKAQAEAWAGRELIHVREIL